MTTLAGLNWLTLQRLQVHSQGQHTGEELLTLIATEFLLVTNLFAKRSDSLGLFAELGVGLDVRLLFEFRVALFHTPFQPQVDLLAGRDQRRGTGLSGVLDGRSQPRELIEFSLSLSPQLDPHRESQHTQHELEPTRPRERIGPEASGLTAVPSPDAGECETAAEGRCGHRAVDPV